MSVRPSEADIVRLHAQVRFVPLAIVCTAIYSTLFDRPVDDCTAAPVLALLFLGRHDGMRTWKSFDWAAMERLHTKGLISDPVGKAKSVVFTDEGLRQSEALFRKLFTVGREA
jgi:hypothetical protein